MTTLDRTRPPHRRAAARARGRARPARGAARGLPALWQGRAGLLWRGFGVGALALAATLIHPLLGAAAGIAASLWVLGPARALFVAAVVGSAVGSLGPEVIDSPALPLAHRLWLIVGAGVAVYLAVAKRFRPGPLTLGFLGVVVGGGLLTTLTSTAPGATLAALATFAGPLAPLVFWADNRSRREAQARSAAYAAAGAGWAVAVASALAILFGKGYGLTGTDFQGVFWQPQFLGVWTLMLAALTLGLRRLPLWLRLGVSTLLFAQVFESWARIAIAAFIVVAVIAAADAGLRRGRRLSRRARATIAAGFAAAVLALAGASWVIAADAAPQADDGRRTGEIASSQAYDAARGAALARSWANLGERPAFGIGFGVPSDPRLLDEAFAATQAELIRAGRGSEILFDKGNSYVAIVEETGIVGAPLWLGLLIAAFALAARTAAGRLTAAAFAVSLLAEAAAFAMGGVGMMLWACLIVSIGGRGGRRNGATRASAGGRRP